MLDMLLSLIAEGAVSGAQSKRLPKALRLVLALLVSAFFLGLGGLMALGAAAMNGPAPRLVCLALAAMCFGYWAFFLRSVWKRMR